MLEPKLLLLDYYLKHPSIAEEYRLHEYMEVSPRHLSRLLNKWMEEGYISYNPLLGKRTYQDIKVLINIENELMVDILNENEQLNSKDLQHLLQLPWSVQYHKAVHTLLNQRLNEQQQVYQYSMMDYVYTIPMTMHPLELNDLVSAQVFSQTLQTLYILDEQNIIRNGIVRYDEWEDNTLHIYLQPEIYFSDGQMLSSIEVIASLERLFNHSSYETLFTNVVSVEKVSKFKLSIHCKTANETLKVLLTDVYSGIYKEKDNKIIGTGPYVLENKTINEIVLRHNMYTKRKPQIHNIHLLKNDEKYFEYDTKQYKSNIAIECPCGMEYVLFNPRNTNITKEERMLIAQVTFEVYREMYEEGGTYRKWLPLKIERISHERTLRTVKVLVDNHTEELFEEVATVLQQYNIAMEMVFLPHEMMLKTDMSTLDVDLVWLAETFHRSAPYQLIDLLTHCKFKDWYQHEMKVKQFYDLLFHKDLKNAQAYSETYLDELKDEALIIPAFRVYRTIMVPREFKNIDINEYGLIDFSKIIVSK